MSRSFTDPDGHILPFCAPRHLAVYMAVDPRQRRFAYAFAGLMVFAAIAAMIGVAYYIAFCVDSYAFCPWWEIAGIEVGFAVMAAFYLYEVRRLYRFARTDLAKLGATPDGRALLDEAQALLDRRVHLVDGSHGPYPLFVALDAPHLRDVVLSREAVELRVWEHHLMLERNLRDRQERHLRGEKVAVIGHLASTP